MEFLKKRALNCNSDENADGKEFEKFILKGEKNRIKRISLWGNEPVDAILSYRTEEVAGLTVFPSDEPIQHIEIRLDGDLKKLGHRIVV